MSSQPEDLPHIVLTRDDATAIVTIDRPAVLNALAKRTLDELREAMRAIGDDETVRAVVITGAGEKAFAAGADLREIATLSPAEARTQASYGQDVFALVERLGKPVVAAVNGFALGGGCELAMACTMRLAADGARFGQPEVTLGLLPGYAGTQRLARLVGQGRALELLLVGEPISAQEAERIGLVNRVVPAAELMPAALALAGLLARRPVAAVRGILETVRRGADMTSADGQALEAAWFGLLAATEDMREGTRAFLEKRPPVFRGR